LKTPAARRECDPTFCVFGTCVWWSVVCVRVCVWAARAARLSSISVNRQPSRKKPKFFFLTTFCLRHVCLCAGSVPRREHQRPPSGNSEKKCKFWTIRLRHVCLRMCVPRVCPSEAASAPDSVRASASTVSRKTCVCVRDAVCDRRESVPSWVRRSTTRATRGHVRPISCGAQI